MVHKTFNDSAWFAGSRGSVTVAGRLCWAVGLCKTWACGQSLVWFVHLTNQIGKSTLWPFLYKNTELENVGKTVAHLLTGSCRTGAAWRGGTGRRWLRGVKKTSRELRGVWWRATVPWGWGGVHGRNGWDRGGRWEGRRVRWELCVWMVRMWVRVMWVGVVWNPRHPRAWSSMRLSCCALWTPAWYEMPMLQLWAAWVLRCQLQLDKHHMIAYSQSQG